MGLKNYEITDYIAKYETEKQDRLNGIRFLIHEGIPEIQEKMWTKVPCFYTNTTSIVIRVFHDHINFVSDAVITYKDELSNYKITPQGMLQIFDNQELPLDTIKKIIGACK